MLTAGTDTYLTAAEADTYITEHYALDSAASYWDALEDAQKEAFLRQALEAIERLPMRGAKQLITQTLMFPRRPYPLYGWGVIDAAAKHAQAEEALMLLRLRLGETIPERDVGKRLASAHAEALLAPWTNGSMTLCCGR